MNFLGLLLALGSIAGAIAFFKKEDDHSHRDVYSDYKVIIEAAAAFKEKHKDFSRELSKLEEFLPEYDANAYKRYSLSLDGKFLVVSELDKPEAEALINQVGGSSYINGELAYLTLRRMNDVSRVLPVANFSIKPDGNLTTTTPIVYDVSACVAEDNEIIEKKWENKKSVFQEPGIYTIRLKIKDKNGNWSEYYEKEIKVTEELGIKSLTAYDQSLFLTYRNGKSLSFGKNEYGQLGIGSLNPISELTYNAMYEGVVEVACGESFNLFRFYDGSVFSAGDNRHGELASGDKAQHKLMNQIWGLENIKQIAAGKRFAAALDYSGQVFVWGDNSENQLMTTEYLDSPYPIKLSGVDSVKEIACGSNFGLALRYDGTVVGWGDNTFGQLGLGYKGSISEPTLTLFKNVKSLAAGDRFSLVIAENGRVYGAGSNSYGQIGIKGKSEYFFPEEVFKVKDALALDVRESLALVITQMGKAMVWGNFNSPGSKPIYDATEIPGVSYVKAYANNGKKCYLLDGNSDLLYVSDLSGKYEKSKMFDNFNDYKETMEAKSQ